QNDCVCIELDVASIGASSRRLGANDDRTHNRLLLNVTAWDNALDATDNHITDASKPATTASEYLDAHHLTSARVVGDFEAGFLLDHDLSWPKAVPLLNENCVLLLGFQPSDRDRVALRPRLIRWFIRLLGLGWVSRFERLGFSRCLARRTQC